MLDVATAIRKKLYGKHAFRHEPDCADCAFERELADAAVIALLAVLDLEEHYRDHGPINLDEHHGIRRALEETVAVIADKLGIEATDG